MLVYPQDISKAWLDSSEIYIGDQVNYNIRITQPENVSLKFTPPADTLTGTVEIITFSAPDTVRGRRGSLILTQVF
ncbi:MAG: hypothetical protein R2727_06885 [Bacteroidales bacterium]